VSNLTFDPSTIEAVVLDAGGVLVLPQFERVRAALDDAGVEHDSSEAAFHRAHYAGMRAYDRSTDPPEVWDGYALAYLGVLGVEVDALDSAARAVRAAFDGPCNELWIWPIAETAAALARLADAGLPLAVVSNADGNIEQALRVAEMVQVGAGRGVEVRVIVDSGIVGIHKPDPRIFPHALEVLDLPAERCVYVGDSVRNDVVGARGAGLHPVHLDPFDLHAGDGHEHDRITDLAALADALLG
jgi:putative hydrolase of the HAD superfamily